MDNSHFGRLCPELRNEIYEYVLSTSEGITLDCSDSAMAFSIKATAKFPNIALTQSCREIQQESSKMYYSLMPLNIITSASTGLPDAEDFSTWDVRSNINAFRRLIGKDQFAEIRRIELTIAARKNARSNFKGLYKLNRQMVYDIRALFSNAAKFEVGFEMRYMPTYLPGPAGAWLHVKWDIDQSTEHFMARLLLAERESIETCQLPVIYGRASTLGFASVWAMGLSLKVECLVTLGCVDEEWN